MERSTENLLEKLKEYGKSDFYPFHMPGHKRRDPMGNFPNPYAIDITEIDGFDNLHHAEGILKEAMDRAAQVYGADQSFYLVNGSTCGILSAICGSTISGGKILMARNCHKAAYHGLILNRLVPVYVYPAYLPELGISGGIRPEDVRELLAKDEKKEIQAVLVVSPTYEGIVSDIAGIAAAAHEHGVPLIVDEAHGAHLPFAGVGSGFPPSALSAGADVVIQSLHKTLPSLTQTAILHIKGKFADREKIARYLGMFQTSSPSYLFMAAMEQCIRFMDQRGRQEMYRYGERMEEFFKRARGLRVLKVPDRKEILGPGEPEKGAPAWAWDPSKIIISCKHVWILNDSGKKEKLSGEALGELLRSRYHLEMEMCAPEYVIGMTSVMDTDEGLRRLLTALGEIDGELEESLKEIDRELETGLEDRWDRSKVPGGAAGKTKEGPVKEDCLSELPQPPLRLSPAVAGEMPAERRKLAESAGFVSGEFIYLYPPGIPVLAPGEEITDEVLDRVSWYQKMGLAVQGLSDPELSTIITVAEK